MTSIHGIIHGRTIELTEDPGIADGQQVQVEVRALSATSKWGEGILRSAGGWCDHPELDEVMQAIQEQRRQERRSQADLA